MLRRPGTHSSTLDHIHDTLLYNCDAAWLLNQQLAASRSNRMIVDPPARSLCAKPNRSC